VACPSPGITKPNGKPGNAYMVDPAIDCVWAHDGNINGATGANPDSFLNGEGTNDAANGTTDTNAAPNAKWFNISGWTFLGSTSNANPAAMAPVTGLTITGSGATERTWAVDKSALPTYGLFALGVKGGSDPKWAVFLLDSLNLAGRVTIENASFAHFVLYGAPGPDDDDVDPVPEPASLALLGSGLAAVAYRLRKRTSRPDSV
jgi:hypothetical protein